MVDKKELSLANITRALAFGMDVTDANRHLSELDLGFEPDLNEIDASEYRAERGEFTVEGGENETAFIAKFRLVELTLGFADLKFTPKEEGE